MTSTNRFARLPLGDIIFELENCVWLIRDRMAMHQRHPTAANARCLRLMRNRRVELEEVARPKWRARHPGKEEELEELLARYRRQALERAKHSKDLWKESVRVRYHARVAEKRAQIQAQRKARRARQAAWLAKWKAHYAHGDIRAMRLVCGMAILM